MLTGRWGFWICVLAHRPVPFGYLIVPTKHLLMNRKDYAMCENLMRRAIPAVLFVLLTFVSVGAQEFRGSLTGKATDPNGAGGPGATVSMKNTETNIVLNTTANADGSVECPLRQPGKNTLTGSHPGLTTAR